MFVREKRVRYKNNDFYFDASLLRITRTEPHFHKSDLEMVFCLDGEVTLTAGHQHVTLRAGDLFSVDYRDIHYLQAEGDNLVLVFHIDLMRTPLPWERLKYQFLTCETVHCSPYQQEAMRRVKDLVFSLSFVCLTEDFSPACDTAAESLIRTLVEDFNFQNYKAPAEIIDNPSSERFERVLAYCCENYSSRITAAGLAEAEHIDANYFSRFIRNTIFISSDSFLKYIRCYEAEHLLLTTDLSNTEISYRCGFSSPRYFYAAFDAWWGCTPHAHREHYRAYMEQPCEMTVIDPAEALPLLQNFITRWHIEKTMRG